MKIVLQGGMTIEIICSINGWEMGISRDGGVDFDSVTPNDIIVLASFFNRVVEENNFLGQKSVAKPIEMQLSQNGKAILETETMRADNVRVRRVFANGTIGIEQSINNELTHMGATEIIDIKLAGENEEVYESALIIYKRNKS